METRFWSSTPCVVRVDVLLGEIATRAHIMADAQIAKGVEAPEAWSIQPETDADTADGMLLRKTLSDAWRRIASVLHEHVLSSSVNATALTVVFRVPVRYSEASCKALPRLLRAYAVSTALAEWFVHCGYDDGGAHATEAASTLEEITRTLSHRVRP